MAINKKKKRKITNIGQDLEVLETLCIMDGNVKYEFVSFSELPYNSSTRRYTPKRTESMVNGYLYTHLHSSISHNCLKVEITSKFQQMNG